ncbi:MAG: PAS domain S-box protein, partial [Verrucomicrobiota bacterium]
RKNGTTFPVEVSLTSYELSGQRVIAALARNLSGRKEYEDQLAQSVSLLRATIESSANGLLVVGLHGKVTLYNNRFAEMWRIPAELMVQGENAALLKAVFDQLIEPASFNQRVEEISQHPESESFDTIKFKDGRVFERVTRPQRLGDKIIGRVWSYRDVTEQKRTHEALERERELLRLMEANTSDRIYFKDLESRFIRVNETMAKLHGCENPADIIGKTDFDVFGKEHAGEAFVDEQRIIQTGIPMIGYEEKELWSNGKITWVSSSKACLRDSEGHIIGTFGISRDITKQKEIELALRENEERMRTLFDLSPDAIMVEDLNGRVLDVNDAACQLHEMTKEELIGKSVYELAPTDTHPTVKIDFAKLVSGQTRNIEGESLTAKGRRIPVDINASRITYVGQPALLINVRDISERRHATEMLRTTQALYSSLVEQMPVCVFRKDAAGRFEFANSRFCELKQLKREEILGRTAAEMAEYKLGQNLSDANDYNFSVVGVNHHNTIMKTGKTIEVDEEYIAPDGEVRFFHVFKTPVFDNNRKIIGSQGIMFDLTDRKQIDEKLRLANERTKFYMSRLPLAFIAWDQDFCVTEWNPAAERMFGWTTAEAIGRHAYELIVPADTQPLVSKVWQEIIAGGNLASHSVNDNVAKDGRRLNCEWRNMPLRDAHSRICGCLSIVEDITERVRNEKQRNELESQLRQSQKMEAVGQLSGGIAHDFNNILTIIQGNAALLQNLDLQPEEIHDASNQISNAAERAAGLTRQLLLFARKQEMQLINLDLNETVAHITKMLQRILGEDLALRTEYASALPLIQADTGMIEQILLNLAVNARDAMSNGGKLTIRTFSEKRSGKTESAVELWVGLQFTDNGSGIAPEILPRIFEPFFTTKKVGKGTGLGLATVYGIVQQHHGTINVQSEPGKGTTFTIAFPAAPVTETSQNLHKPQPTLPWGTETILLVEDEIPLRTFVSDLLQRCGYTVLEADSGPAALKIWATNRDKINLLFTDVIMPENMNGIELGQRLLAEKPALKIIYTSGYTGNLESRRATLVEGTNFIRKPFKPDGIANIIRYRLDEKSPAK